MGVTRAVMVGDGASSKIIINDDEERDWLRSVLSRLDRVREQFFGVDTAVDANYFHLRRDACLKRRTPDNGVRDDSITAHLEADGIDIAEVAAAAFQLRRPVVEYNFPATVFDPSHGCFCGSRIQPAVEECGPFKRSQSVQHLYQFVEGISLHLTAMIGAAVEFLAEIINRFLAARLAMNNGGYFKPKQVALVVVIGAAAPVHPSSSSEASASAAGYRNGGIEQWAPGTAGASGAEHGCDAGQALVGLLWGPQAAACRQHGPKVIR